MVEFQKFLTSLSVLPGSCLAICDHLWKRRYDHMMMTLRTTHLEWEIRYCCLVFCRKEKTVNPITCCQAFCGAQLLEILLGE